jgi:hypothetical protein
LIFSLRSKALRIHISPFSYPNCQNNPHKKRP